MAAAWHSAGTERQVNANGRGGLGSDRPFISRTGFQMTDSVEAIISDAQRGVEPNEIRQRAASVTWSDIDRQRLEAMLKSLPKSLPRPRSGLLTIGG
jgi:hypothetical protein